MSGIGERGMRMTGYRDNKTEYVPCSFRKKNKGAALIVAIIVMAVLMVFAFSLMLVTYTLYSSQNKKIASKKCSEAANTLSQAMETELQDSDAYINSDLWIYLRFHLLQSDWPFYEPKLDGHKASDAVKTYEMFVNPQYIKPGEATITGYPGSIKLKVYWMLPESVYEEHKNDREMTYISNLNPASFTMTDKKDIRLFVEIVCESASQTYTVTNEYTLQAAPFASEDSPEKKKLENNYSGSDLYNKDGKYTIDFNEHWIWKFEERN